MFLLNVAPSSKREKKLLGDLLDGSVMNKMTQVMSLGHRGVPLKSTLLLINL